MRSCDRSGRVNDRSARFAQGGSPKVRMRLSVRSAHSMKAMQVVARRKASGWPRRSRTPFENFTKSIKLYNAPLKDNAYRAGDIQPAESSSRPLVCKRLLRRCRRTTRRSRHSTTALRGSTRQRKRHPDRDAYTKELADLKAGLNTANMALQEQGQGI